MREGRYPGKPLESVHRLWTAVRHAAQLDDVRLHDIRHSVASVAGGHGYSLFPQPTDEIARGFKAQESHFVSVLQQVGSQRGTTHDMAASY